MIVFWIIIAEIQKRQRRENAGSEEIREKN